MIGVIMALPSLQQSKLARRALNSGEPMSRVLAFFNNKFDVAQVTAGIERLRAIQSSRRDVNHRWKSIVDFDRVDIPEAVTAERHHRATLVPRDTTALRMGDPLPGYSAADKMAPSIAVGRQSDPLDGLMFGRRKIAVMAE